MHHDRGGLEDRGMGARVAAPDQPESACRVKWGHSDTRPPSPVLARLAVDFRAQTDWLLLNTQETVAVLIQMMRVLVVVLVVVVLVLCTGARRRTRGIHQRKV